MLLEQLSSWSALAIFSSGVACPEVVPTRNSVGPITRANYGAFDKSSKKESKRYV
jgi:hypothetical protein